MPTALEAAAVEGDDAPLVKLHANHGKPCANPACRQPLVTGKIRVCNLRASGGTTRRHQEVVHDEEGDRGRRRERAPAAGMGRLRALESAQPKRAAAGSNGATKVLGTCFAEALDRDDLEPETVMYYVSGRFRAGSHEREQSRWMTPTTLIIKGGWPSVPGTVSFWASMHWEGPGQLEEAEEREDLADGTADEAYCARASSESERMSGHLWKWPWGVRVHMSSGHLGQMSGHLGQMSISLLHCICSIQRQCPCNVGHDEVDEVQKGQVVLLYLRSTDNGPTDALSPALRLPALAFECSAKANFVNIFATQGFGGRKPLSLRPVASASTIH